MSKQFLRSALLGILALTSVLAQAPVKSVKDVTVSNFKIRVTDDIQASDWSQGFENVAYPSKGKDLTATDEQRLQLSFNVLDSAKSAQQPHQVFVKIASKSKEVIFVPDVDTQSLYKLDIDLKAKATQFDNLSGLYEISLIVGDVKIKPVQWSVGSLDIQFSKPATTEPDYYAKRPDIVHKFREPEKRPHVFVSNVFGLAVLVLFVAMLFLWSRIGLSLGNFTASSLLFQLSFGAILYLEYLFYAGNDMFTTLRYLSWASPFALYFGRSMLAHSAKIEP